MKAFHSIPVFLTLFICLWAAGACDKMLDTEPRSSISDELALRDLNGINATLIGLYSRMASSSYYGRNFISGELMSDQAKVTLSAGASFRSHPTNMDGAGFGFWNHAYDNINRTNLILFYIDDVDATAEEINQLKGETYFMRGLFYFDLLRIYARAPIYQSPMVQGQPLGVILKTQPFLGIDESTFASRATIDEGYDLVENDLLQSISHFDASMKDYPYRANLLAAKALLARVYLYRGKWTQARDLAQEVIATAPPLATAENYSRVFTATPGIESIFELFYSEADRQSNQSIAGIALRRAEDQAGYGDVIFRQDLLDQFEPGDVRRNMTVNYVMSGEPVVYQTKFAGHKGMPFWDDVPVIRTSEVYLILAEAQWENQEYDQARHTMNTLRQNRGIPALSASDVPNNQLIDAILKERRVELCWEHSHRWFDLRRRGMDIPKGLQGTDPGETLDYSDYRVVERIDISGEAQVNPNLIQNPGY